MCTESNINKLSRHTYEIILFNAMHTILGYSNIVMCVRLTKVIYVGTWTEKKLVGEGSEMDEESERERENKRQQIIKFTKMS